MKLLYVTNLPAPYKIEFFTRLANDVELTVAYERRTATDRNEKWKSESDKRNFEEIWLKGKEIGTESSFSLDLDMIKLLRRREFDTVIMNGFSSPTAIVSIAYMQMRGIKYGIMCDGMLPGECFGLKYRLKRFLIANADYYLSSNKLTTDTLLSCGANEERIYLYPFSSVSNSEIAQEDYDKECYKKALGLAGKKIILYVGRFLPVKGIDILMEAYKKIKNCDNHLILIGGGRLRIG